MGKKGGGAKKLAKSDREPHASISLREEATGKLQTKASTNVKSILKVEHLKKLVVWATHEAQIPSLGAFYGQHLASVAEAAGVPPDPSLITCQRFSFYTYLCYFCFGISIFHFIIVYCCVSMPLLSLGFRTCSFD